MLTILKKIFTWWNRYTLSTKLKTIFFGRFVGSDTFGNRYYESKSGKRWVIYSGEIDASKIPVEWYSWIHFTQNKIEKNHNLEKYEWQNLINLILQEQNLRISPIKIKMPLKKNIKAGKIKSIIFKFFSIFLFILFNNQVSSESLEGKSTHIKILDKISSKNILLKLSNGKEIKYKDLLIKSIKCKNSQFDDNPEITAYLQVEDLIDQNKDDVFVFNGWMFSSSPSIKPFDHPVYDIWLVGCY